MTDKFVVVKAVKAKGKSTDVVEEKKSESLVKVSVPSMPSRVKLPQIGVWMNYTLSETSAAATANAVVLKLAPAFSAEFTTFAALYSECKVTHGEVLYYLAVPDETQVNALDCILAYDPAKETAFTSIVDGMSTTQHKLVNVKPSNAVVVAGPLPVNGTGFWKFKFSVPNGATKNITEGNDLSTGMWSNTADQGGAGSFDIYGYLKTYIQAASAGTTQLIGYIRLWTTFRNRT